MKTLVVLALLCCGALYYPLHAQERLSVRDAIAQGLQNNYAIRIARNNRQSAENNIGKGSAGLLPTLDFTSSYKLSGSSEESNSPINTGDSDARDFNAQLSLNWTLFDGFRMWADKRRYNELALLGGEQARGSIENTVLNIVRSYFNLVQQEQLLQVARSALAVSETRLERERARNDLGGAMAPLINARVAYNTDRTNVVARELAVEIARKELNLAMGREPAASVQVDVEEMLPEPRGSLEELLQQMEEQNNALAMARRNKVLAENNIELQRARFYPRVSLSASYGYGDNSRSSSGGSEFLPNETNTTRTDAVLSLNVSYNLFNGWRDDIDLQNARVEALSRELDVQDELNRARGLLREKYQSYQKQRALLELENASVETAQHNLDLQTERYEIGTATSLDYRDAQLSLFQAQTSQIVARYQLNVTTLEIEQLTGALRID